MFEVLDEILPRVTKPARYTGGEFNAVTKDHACVDVRFALAFPDVYEIGMSNLGMRILYEIMNRRDDTVCERVFAPWPDMEAEMRGHDLPLFSIETRAPVRDFDILGFSLGYELSYPNVLNMLDLAGIPVRSSERTETHPLVVAGGCCTYNPEPIAEFCDVFVIGEGEEIIHELITHYREHKTLSRRDLLRELARIEGIYVPSLYEVSYNEDGTIREINPGERDVPKTIGKRLVRDLDTAEYLDRPVIPYIETVHDRIALEVMRGCARGCRFCQAGMIYRPVRERSSERLLRTVEELEPHTGYDEIGLMSLSTADYRGIEGLVHTLIEKYEPRKIGVSLPSTRADAPCVALAAEIQKVRKSGLTLAPEAGTQRLRDVINKNVTEENLLSAVEAAFRYGWRTIKLYFMTGLPTETDEDIEGIARMAMEVAQVARRMRIRPTLNVSVACFVPKPHTPFQWRAQDTIEELERKQAVLRNALRDRTVKLSWHDARTSALEGVLARGDRRVGKAIYRAWQSGCKFDAWDEYFDFAKWQEAFAAVGIDPHFYASRQRSYDEVLPWDHIDCGVSKRFLVAEDKRAVEGKVTQDCRLDKCSGCGMSRITPECATACQQPTTPPAGGKSAEGSPADDRSPSGDHVPVARVMLSLGKGDSVKYLSHLDLMGAFQSALRRARIPTAFSSGFNPRPRMSVGNPVGVGTTSDDERIVLELTEPESAEEIRERLNANLPSGIRVLAAEPVPANVKSPISGLNASTFRITAESGESCEAVGSALKHLLAENELRIRRVRADKYKEVDIRPHIASADMIECSDGRVELEVSLKSGDSGGARPQDFMEALRRFVPSIETRSTHRRRQFHANQALVVDTDHRERR